MSSKHSRSPSSSSSSSPLLLGLVCPENFTDARELHFQLDLLLRYIHIDGDACGADYSCITCEQNCNHALIYELCQQLGKSLTVVVTDLDVFRCAYTSLLIFYPRYFSISRPPTLTDAIESRGYKPCNAMIEAFRHVNLMEINEMPKRKRLTPASSPINGAVFNDPKLLEDLEANSLDLNLN